MKNQPFIRAVILALAITMVSMVGIALLLTGAREVLIISINGG